MKKQISKTIKFLALLLALSSLLSGCFNRGGAGANDVNSTSEVKIVKDVLYYDGKSSDPDRHILDIYIPRGVENYPVLIFMHGGAWMVGDKAGTALVGMIFAHHGIGVVNVNYRMYPQVQYPGFSKDVARALRWTVDHIDNYGGNPNNIFVAGHSAGGHLAALLATHDGFLSQNNLSSKNIRGVIGISGAYNIIEGFRPNIFTKDPEIRKDASPYYHVKNGLPPFLLLYADNDRELAESQVDDFGDKLRKYGVPVIVSKIADRNHGSILGRISNNNDPVRLAMLNFINEYKQ